MGEDPLPQQLVGGRCLMTAMHWMKNQAIVMFTYNNATKGSAIDLAL